MYGDTHSMGSVSRMTDELLSHPSVRRVREALDTAGVTTPITVLDGAARTAAQAAEALGTSVAAIANSLVFTLTGVTVRPPAALDPNPTSPTRSSPA